jgi:hypothetical protein
MKAKKELMALIELYNDMLKEEIPNRKIIVSVLLWGNGAKNELYYTEHFKTPKKGALKSILIKTKHNTYKGAANSLHGVIGLILQLLKHNI